MKLYGSPRTRSDRVAWMLHELGVEHEFVEIDFAKGDHRSPEYLALNPNGKVPVLVDGELVLYESAAICLYLAEKYPNNGLMPESLAERAQCFQWIFFAFTELEAPLWTRAKHKFVFPKERRVPEIFASCEWEFQERLKTLEAALEGREFLVGNQFTVADLIVTGMIGWARSLDLVGDSFPRCLAYGKKHQKRFRPKSD
jgi:glutathione S-transferase